MAKGLAFGAAVGAAQEITTLLDEIRNIANQTLSGLADEASSSGQRFLSSELTSATFGSDPEAARMFRTASGAHQVFAATVTGLEQVLEQYRQNLLLAASEYESADEMSEEQMLARLNSLNSVSIATTEGEDGTTTYDDVNSGETQAYDEHAEDLAEPEEAPQPDAAAGDGAGDADDGVGDDALGS